LLQVPRPGGGLGLKKVLLASAVSADGHSEITRVLDWIFTEVAVQVWHERDGEESAAVAEDLQVGFDSIE
jgi:hypothetical protein